MFSLGMLILVEKAQSETSASVSLSLPASARCGERLMWWCLLFSFPTKSSPEEILLYLGPSALGTPAGCLVRFDWEFSDSKLMCWYFSISCYLFLIWFTLYLSHSLKMQREVYKILQKKKSRVQVFPSTILISKFALNYPYLKHTAMCPSSLVKKQHIPSLNMVMDKPASGVIFFMNTYKFPQIKSPLFPYCRSIQK